MSYFASNKPAGEVKAILELALRDYAGRPVGVLVRTAVEMAEILAANPFPAGAPNRTMTIFLDDPPSPAALDASSGKHDEEMALGRREIYIHYPSGMGRSKLRIPTARTGTARNMNTIATLSTWAASLPD
jgi:uncharacterized protein (DUF1697 family)